jgi:hypothetical protein
MKQRLLISFQYVPKDSADAAFAADPRLPKYRFLRGLRAYFQARGVEVHTIDMWDRVEYDHALFMDVSWRTLLGDAFHRHIPQSRRALVLIEPPNVNPAPYYLRPLRRLYANVFTWYEPLLRGTGYARIAPMMGVDLHDYRQRSSPASGFDNRRLLVAVNSNRWAYHPHSQYVFRKRVFRFLETHAADQFDLYGYGWNAPSVPYERLTGYPRFACYRGAIGGDYDSKIPVLGRYRFALCIENTARDPGYVSEKPIDTMCARCVPVYHGWEGVTTRIPPDCFVNMQDFRDLADLLAFLRSVDVTRHERYLSAIDAFLNSRAAESFRDENLYRILHGRLYGDRPASAGLLE